MAVFMSSIHSYKIVSRLFELRARSIDLVFSLAVYRGCLYHKRDFKTKNKSGKQVVKEVKPVKVVALHKNSSRFVPRNVERQLNAQQLSSFHDEEHETYEDKLALAASKYSSKMAAHHAEEEFTKSLVKNIRSIRRHTIKQKYFKPSPFPDLLTWAAKEQIRYLHKIYPDSWPVDELLENFPVSEDYLHYILKDNRKLFQEEDILKHDKCVLERWKRLRGQIESGDISEEDYKNYMKCFFNSQFECVVQNATRLSDYPYPQEPKKPKMHGGLSAIVQDCLQLQEKETKILLKEKIPSVTDQLSSLLQDVAILLNKFVSKEEKTKKENLMIPVTNDIKPRGQGMHNMQVKTTLFGNSLDITREIRVHKDKPSMSGTYIKNKSVYDENGEFLYKIP